MLASELPFSVAIVDAPPIFGEVRVASGGTYAPPDYIAPAAAFYQPASAASRTTLTVRQREVLRLIACGLANY